MRAEESVQNCTEKGRRLTCRRTLSKTMFLFANAVHDWMTRRRIHPVSLWAAGGIFVWDNLLAATIGPSDGWHRFVAWLTA